MAEYSQGGTWDPTGILGAYRFLNRVCDLFSKLDLGKKIKTENGFNSKEHKDLNRILHKTIKKVGEDIVDFKFNTAISSLMILLNETEKRRACSIRIWRIFFLKLLCRLLRI